jgi:hypothetical protein
MASKVKSQSSYRSTSTGKSARHHACPLLHELSCLRAYCGGYFFCYFGYV